MADLKGFANKDMIEQIMILDEIRESGKVEILPELMDLYATPQKDQAVDEMVYHALYDSMAGQAEAVGNGLRHPEPRVQLLCIRRACEDGDVSLLPVLKGLLAECSETETISEILRAFGGFQDPSLIETLIPYIRHEDDAVTAWAMNSLVALGGEEARTALQELVSTNAGTVESSGVCDLTTAQAIGNVAKFQEEGAVNFLVSYIHHPVASLRKVVINSLVSMGDITLPALESCLNSGDKDEKIMAANIIGWTGHKKGADMLNALLDHEGELETNLRFAVYEALGRIRSVRSFIGLVDGLNETDEMVLMAVVIGLNEQCNPGIIKTVNELFAKKGQQAEKVLQAMVTGRTMKIFTEVYKTGEHGTAFIEAILALGDAETTEAFRLTLEGIDVPQAAADMERLAGGSTASGQEKAWKVLAADDSKAMLFFYKGAAADLGIELMTFPDGKDAYEYMSGAGASDDIDLLVTDMNMPEMDGIELTRELRKIEQWANLPILMATTETEKAQADQARQAGVDDFISKPFSKDDFKSKLSEILNK